MHSIVTPLEHACTPIIGQCHDTVCLWFQVTCPVIVCHASGRKRSQRSLRVKSAYRKCRRRDHRTCTMKPFAGLVLLLVTIGTFRGSMCLQNGKSTFPITTHTYLIDRNRGQCTTGDFSNDTSRSRDLLHRKQEQRKYTKNRILLTRIR